MFRKIVFYDRFIDRSPESSMDFFFWGLVSFIFGILVLLVPRLLIILIATGFVTIGVMLLALAYKAKKQERSFFNLYDQLGDWRLGRFFSN